MEDKIWIKRTILPELIKNLDRKEIMVLTGPRQAGKTSLVNKLREKCEKEGIKTAYLNLDFERDMRQVRTQDKLLSKIGLELGKTERGICFIDEIQRKENAGIFLKGLYDMNLPHKIVVTGSGSLELKEKIHESLVGRKQIFQVNPLSFTEYADFETDYRYTGRLNEYFRQDMQNIMQILNSYFNFGGYPKVAVSQNIIEKKEVIEDIFENYIKNDIREIAGIGKTAEFADLFRMLSFLSGKLVNYDQLAKTLRLTYSTVNNYLYLLEKTFVIKIIRPYVRNPKTEIVKAPVVYFHDFGLRNSALNLFGKIDLQLDISETGFLFQNLVMNILNGLGFDDLRFWRTKNGAEVDFILNGLTKPIPVEVKFAHLKDDNLGRSLISFIEKYRPERAIVVNLSLEKKRVTGKTEVVFIPFYRLEELFKNEKTNTKAHLINRRYSRDY